MIIQGSINQFQVVAQDISPSNGHGGERMSPNSPFWTGACGTRSRSRLAVRVWRVLLAASQFPYLDGPALVLVVEPVTYARRDLMMEVVEASREGGRRHGVRRSKYQAVLVM